MPHDKPKVTDEVLDEIHATRQALLEEHGGIHGLFAFLQEQEAKSTHPKAMLVPRTIKREQPGGKLP